MNKASVFSAPLILPYSAINANGRVKADWLLNVFQDISSQQCSHLGISGFDMAKKQLKWVVAQYRIQIHDAFKWLMPLTLNTWRAPWKNLYEIRQFTLVPETPPGEEPLPPLVTATGIWILIRAESGKPVRLAPHMPAGLLDTPADRAPRIEKPARFDEYHHETTFPVRFLDLDLNQHVNNRVYLRWAVETLPEPYCFEYAPARCTVVYKKEGLFGDRILSRIHMDLSGPGLRTEHAIIRQETGEELARLMLEWTKISPMDIFNNENG
ncbi:MAG: hypothetical protein HUN04_02180 [Desulfobacter sp.]|nr:MAG: hypothetical protein HUN04_02180 [Desulfobacter sp.]